MVRLGGSRGNLSLSLSLSLSPEKPSHRQEENLWLAQPCLILNALISAPYRFERGLSRPLPSYLFLYFSSSLSIARRGRDL